MRDLVIGVDIGATSIDFGFVDKSGNVICEFNVLTVNMQTPEKLVEHIYAKAIELGLIKRVLGIGIGAPNGNFYSGKIEFAPNLHWKGSIPMASLFQEKFDLKASLTNDANAAAIGEMLYGNARDLNHFVTITLGTGLGSGIIVDGELIYGHDGFAGEYGHIRVIPNGRLCGCGRRGCLETYVSATGVVRSIQELDYSEKEKSSLMQLSKPSSEDVFNAAKEGDQFAQYIIDFTTDLLGSCLADFACITSPEAYVLFGGIAQSGKDFADKVKIAMEKNMLNIYKNKIEIRISSLHEVNAAVLGAASLIWKNKD